VGYGIQNEVFIIDDELDGILWTNRYTFTTATAFFTNHSPAFDNMDDIDKTDIFSAGTATGAVGGHFQMDTGHTGELGTQFGRQVGNEPKQATAGATIADGHEFRTGRHPHPDSIDLITTDQVDQAQFLAFRFVCQGLLPGNQATQVGVNIQNTFTQEETAIIMGKFLAMIGSAADTFIHDEVIVGLINKITHDIRRNNDILGFFDLGVDENPILGQVK
jgi:hypothetical protein